MSAVFHLSICVNDIEGSRAFYVETLGCREGNATASYVDFWIYGNQLTCHVAPELVRPASAIGLDGNHFGLILPAEEFVKLEAKLRSRSVSFLKEPETEHRGTPRERRKMIVTDPSGNALEFKCYVNPSADLG